MAASAVKRLLSSSPISFSRSLTGDGKSQLTLQPYFGVQLSDIVRREGKFVPNLVTKISSFILERGLDQVGIFRISGNVKVVERLRTSFDRNGDAVFSDTVDVMAVAGLLKLFLRELPETLIPECFTQHFVAAQEASIKDPDGYVRQMKLLLSDLPDCNYATLKYLLAFLVLVTREEDENKMNANALATIFGPNMFRCMSGLLGLKEQGITNCVTLHFITNFDELFLEKGELSPHSDRFQLSALVLSKPSRTLRPEPQSVSRLSFQRADESDGISTAKKQTTSNVQSSSAVQESERNDTTVNHPPTTPVMTAIQDAINQAILEYVFGETVENCRETEDNVDESYNSWSLSDDDDDDEDDDDNRIVTRDAHNNLLVRPTAAAKTPDSDSLSGSETSSEDDSEDEVRPRRSDAVIRRHTTGSSERNSHDRDWPQESEKISRRPVSGSMSPVKKSSEPVSAYPNRATSAPNSRPSAIGTKENFTRLESTTSGQVYSSKESANSAANGGYVRRGHQTAPKSPLVEKQAWTISADPNQDGKSASNIHRNLFDNQDDRRHPKDLGNSSKEEAALSEFKRLRKRVHICKRKIREFEEDFESTNGYKPMHSDKIADREVKRSLEELPELRRQLSELGGVLESLQEEKRNGGNGKKGVSRPKMEETLATLMTKLNEKRKSASRPDDLSDMTREEICEEKICIQKALLHFETLHGRPSSPGEKELMHPLYDRYRKIKRLLAKQSNHGDEVDDIQNAPGNLSFISSLTQSTVPGIRGTNLRSGKNSVNSHSSTKGQPNSNLYSVGRNDLLDRQRDAASRRRTELSSTRETVGRMLNEDENLNLSQLSLPRLLSELQKTKAEKKHLQLVLHNFEEEFQREHGRKVQKYDQLHMEREYKQYKTIKAKLKLLEVLLAKHQSAK